jgi:hypothetical protein
MTLEQCTVEAREFLKDKEALVMTVDAKERFFEDIGKLMFKYRDTYGLPESVVFDMVKKQLSNLVIISKP